MFYDYLITQFYPNIIWLVCISVLCIIFAIAIYSVAAEASQNKVEFSKNWKNKFLFFVGFHALLLMFYFWIPDVEYVKYFYGDVRVTTLTPEQIAKQKAELQADYDRHYERSKQLLLDCLDKGQKQPHTTTFNDTNEVIKTCYDVAKYKF
ncbi:TPA: hypothetical protein ACNICG_002819 [Acinetobacter baumannii]